MRGMSAKALPESLARHLAKGRAERALQVGREAIDEEARTAVLAFASEDPYERFWGVEILDCQKKSMRLGRLKSGANLLCDHDTKDVVGVVESVEIGADKVARAVVRFGKSARAEEVWQDVRDGIRRNVSVGYVIHAAQLVETKEGQETYRVTDWEPLEVSLVSVPADATVGIGRALDAPEPTSSPIPKESKMEPEVKAAPAATVVVAERNHAAEITKIAATIPGGAEMAMRAIQEGKTVEAFQADAIKALASKPVPTADIGMDKKEVQRYSVVRALHALANPQDANAQKAAAFERECSAEVAKRSGKDSRGIFMPYEVQKRDLLVGTATAGGNAVATDMVSFIDLFRNAMVINGLGVQMLTGLVGNIAIPKLSGSATAYWVAENTAPTESQQTFAQVTMAPKTVGAFTDISRKLLLQASIDVEGLVNRDLATVLGLAVQQAVINGSGASNQPTGILTAVTASQVGGTNGLAPTWDHIIGLETDIASVNADVGSMAYLTNAKVRGKLKRTQKFSSTNGDPIWNAGGEPLNGYRAGVTNAVPSNLTKGSSSGVCSAIVFGNFADLIIGMWGTLDMMVDPYTGSTAGTVRVVALQDVDVAIRHVESFATMVDALTA